LHSEGTKQTYFCSWGKNLKPCQTNGLACFNYELCIIHNNMQCHVLPGQETKKEKKFLSLIITKLEGKKLKHGKED
jgi:hypothetical protein